MSPHLTGVIIAAGLIVLLAILLAGIYNRLVTLRQRYLNAWSQIDVQLKRRYDLIPNLVETVKGYAKHESGTLERIVQARNQALTASSVADKAAAEGQLSIAIKGVIGLAEAYPDLKANQNFLALQEELTATENRIGFARQHYNDVVGQYNAGLMSFPANVVAGMFGFRPAEFFQLDPAEAAAVKQAPKVQF
jgi:LemA protein